MRKAWFMMFLAAVVIAGCNSGKNANTADLRTVNAVIDAEPLDILIDDSVKASAIAFQAAPSYVEVPSGTHTLTVRSSLNAAILASRSIGLNDISNNTLLLYGKRGSMSSTLLVDDTTDPTSGFFKLRFTSLSAEAGAVDIYVSGVDISGAPVTIPAISAGGVSDYAQVTAGTYALTLTTSGTKDIVFQTPPQAYSAGAKLTLVAMPAGGGKLVNAMLLNGSSGAFLPNSFARLKAVNSIGDSSGLTFKADGTVLLSNVPYTGASSYVTTSAGTRNLQLEASNAPGATIASQSQAIGPARDYTIAAAGTISSPQLVLLTDDNSAPSAGAARMRFANMSADAASVDVLVNFAAQASSIAARTASGYISLVAGTTSTYTVTFATPGGVSVITSIDTGALDVGAVYTVYLFGPSSSPQARLVRDR
jgi:hypothetical protein